MTEITMPKTSDEKIVYLVAFSTAVANGDIAPQIVGGEAVETFRVVHPGGLPDPPDALKIP